MLRNQTALLSLIIFDLRQRTAGNLRRVLFWARGRGMVGYGFPRGQDGIGQTGSAKTGSVGPAPPSMLVRHGRRQNGTGDDRGHGCLRVRLAGGDDANALRRHALAEALAATGGD